MKVIVKGYFELQKAMEGKRLVEVEKDSATLRELLRELSDRFGKELTDRIYPSETEEPAGRLLVLVNGRNHLATPDRLDTQLKDGDEIALFPPLAGG